MTSKLVDAICEEFETTLLSELVPDAVKAKVQGLIDEAFNRISDPIVDVRVALDEIDNTPLGKVSKLLDRMAGNADIALAAITKATT
jgi:hypothetical protein